MSHLYPLAETATQALNAERPTARTRYDAERLANGTPITALQTDWIKHADAEAGDLEAVITAGRSHGFVQVYEDAEERPVYAVTYWKLDGPIGATPPKPAPLKETPISKPAQKTQDDHTDDLYFRRPAARTRKRKRHIDPRQMDLFVSPDARGYEHADPDNPNIIVNDEEGDGTTFGG